MGFVAGRSQFNWEHGIPCRNPKCKSYMKPGGHPNCRCGSSGPEAQVGRSGPSRASGPSKSITSMYAQGGEVHHCSTMQPHEEGCEFFADGGQIAENQDFQNAPLAVDHAISHHGLLHALTKTGHSKSENENKHAEDFMDAAKRGRKLVAHHSSNTFEKSHKHPEPDKNDIQALKKHLDSIRENPSFLLGVAGNLGGDHAAALGAKAATASNYLNGLRPKTFQSSPLDEQMPEDKMQNAHYERQIGVAQSPLSILSHIKAGTVQPEDLQTLQTLYPHLSKSLQSQVGEALINAKTNETEIPYKHKMGLSHLLEQPLDSTMTQPAMSAIIMANGSAQSEGPASQKKKSGATAATLKQINKVDSLYETPIEERQITKRV